jgi:transposase InsO family protein
MQLVMFDLTKMVCPTKGGLLWVLIVKDHFTKFNWTEAFVGKDSRLIARYLFCLFRQEGTPERWHSDNGGEFKGEYFDAAMHLLCTQGYSISFLFNCCFRSIDRYSMVITLNEPRAGR